VGRERTMISTRAGHWHGRRKGGSGGLGPLALEIFRKKGCFLSFEWEKSKLTACGPP